MLDIAIVAWIITTWRPARTASYLLMPYLAWTLYATALTAGFVARN